MTSDEIVVVLRELQARACTLLAAGDIAGASAECRSVLERLRREPMRPDVLAAVSATVFLAEAFEQVALANPRGSA